MVLAIHAKSPFSQRALFGLIVCNMSESPSSTVG
jgi:hypothetical protein